MSDYTTTTNYDYWGWEYCGYRLPCGLCRLTNSICPRQIKTKTNEVTCSTEVTK